MPNPQAIISVDIWTVLQTEESLCILRVSEVSKVCNKGEGSLLTVSFEKRICGQQDALGEINFVFK